MAISSHDIVPDSPTNTFATLNPLKSDITALSDGNLKTQQTASAWAYAWSTISIPKNGKYYAECLIVSSPSAGNNQQFGIQDADVDKRFIYDFYYTGNGRLNQDGVQSDPSTGALSAGTIISILIDADNLTANFYVNNSILSSPTYSLTSTTDYFVFFNGYSSGVSVYNFGQDPTFGGNKLVNQNFNQAWIYSVYGDGTAGSLRSANYTVQYSDDNTNWTTAWTGIASNNQQTGLIQNSGGGGSYGSHPFWRYVEGSSIDYHHPKVSRIVLANSGSDFTNLKVYNADNTSNTGVSAIGTVSSEFGTGDTDANGIGSFYYSPPTGALALCTANLPDPDIDPNVDDLPEDYFRAVAYSGSIGNDQLVDCGFPADLIWIKGRTASYNTAHMVYDTIRGRTSVLQTQNTDDEFDYGNLAPTISTASTPINGFKTPPSVNNNINASANTYVAWCFRAGGAPSGSTSTTGSAKRINTSGTQDDTSCDALASAASTAGASNVITPTLMSINQKAGFSIVKYSGNGSIPHGLSSPLDLLIVKVINLDGENWGVWHSSFSSGDYIYLNSPNQKYNYSSIFSGVPSSTVFQVGADSTVGNSSYNYIAYCWHSVAGYSAFGSYTGNGSTDGPFIYTGFKPAWLMVKNTSTTDTNSNWSIFDSARQPYNISPAANRLEADTANAEDGDGRINAGNGIDMLSNGFKVRAANWFETNGSGDTYIYAAFAEMPFKYATAR